MGGMPVGDLVRAVLAGPLIWHSQDAACTAFARTITDRRVLLDLLTQPGAERLVAARARARSCDADRLLSDPVLHGLMARRPIIGLLRRSRAEAEAIALDAIRRSLEAPRARHLAEIARALGWAGIAEPALFGAGGPFGQAGVAAMSLIDRLRAIGWGTEARPLPYCLGDQLARCIGLGGYDEDRGEHWVQQISAGRRLYPDEASLLAAAARIGASGLFDADRYRRIAGIVCDDATAAVHNALLGDAMGLAPSDGFDPDYYAARNPDVTERGEHWFLHYLDHGHREGRRPVSPVPFRGNAASLDATRDNIVLVLHEASRTGAPVLGWNIARHLAERYNVFTILLGDGPLMEAFAALSAATLGPVVPHEFDPPDYEFALSLMLDRQEITYAIVNSCESRVLLEPCLTRRIPTLLLMHEFGSYVYARDSLRAAFDMATEIVFPARLVAESSLAVHPKLRSRPIHILPQGMSVLPAPTVGALKVAPPPGLRRVAEARAAGAFVVLGAGTVGFRKGVDLFLAAAMAVCRAASVCPVHFVWIGHGYRPDEDMVYSIYLQEQRERSGLREHVTFVDELPDLEPAYALADVFLLASRLDPLPNVSIDAAHRGIPIVCFADASGAAEILMSDQATAAGVVAHLDTAAAAAAILALIGDRDLWQRRAAATRELARRVFDMAAYCEQLDALGRAASRRLPASGQGDALAVAPDALV